MSLASVGPVLTWTLCETRACSTGWAGERWCDCARGTGSPLDSCLSLQKGEVPPIICWTALPTSWQVTFQLVPRLRREDATTSYLTSGPRLHLFLPVPPKWIPGLSPRGWLFLWRTLSAARLPWRRRTRTEKAKTGLIVLVARKFCWGGKEGGKIRDSSLCLQK